jgi:hypothetical protein
LENNPDLWLFSIFKNEIASLHKNTFKNNFKLKELHLGYNKLNALSNTMFSHLKHLNLLFLGHNNCISKDIPENAYSKIIEIEKDLLSCGISYLSLENDEIMAQNAILMEKLDKLLSWERP